jgi:YD repeat-containing protein
VLIGTDQIRRDAETHQQEYHAKKLPTEITSNDETDQQYLAERCKNDELQQL